MEPQQPPEPLPYENGDHCIFYAIQGASMYFNGQPLTATDRTHFQQERQKAIELLEAKRAVGLGSPGDALLSTLDLMLPKLEDRGIIPTQYMSKPESKDALDKADKLKQVSFKPLDQTSPIPEPVLLFIQPINRSTGQDHVWFCRDGETFRQESSKHIGKNDAIVMTLSLKKATANTDKNS